MTCHACQEPAVMECDDCNQPACEEHSHSYPDIGFGYCAECVEREREKHRRVYGV